MFSIILLCHCSTLSYNLVEKTHTFLTFRQFKNSSKFCECDTPIIFYMIFYWETEHWDSKHTYIKHEYHSFIIHMQACLGSALFFSQNSSYITLKYYVFTVWWTCSSSTNSQSAMPGQPIMAVPIKRNNTDGLSSKYLVVSSITVNK